MLGLRLFGRSWQCAAGFAGSLLVFDRQPLAPFTPHLFDRQPLVPFVPHLRPVVFCGGGIPNQLTTTRMFCPDCSVALVPVRRRDDGVQCTLVGSETIGTINHIAPAVQCGTYVLNTGVAIWKRETLENIQRGIKKPMRVSSTPVTSW